MPIWSVYCGELPLAYLDLVAASIAISPVFSGRMALPSIWYDPGAGFAAQGAPDVGWVGDEGLFAAAFQEPDEGLDLGGHGALSKVDALRQVALGFGYCHPVDPLLVGCAEI